MSHWVVFNVGCIECGEESWLHSVHEDLDSAQKALAAEAARMGIEINDSAYDFEYFSGGQNRMGIFKELS